MANQDGYSAVLSQLWVRRQGQVTGMDRRATLLGSLAKSLGCDY
jgi:hypothetical protein